MPVPCMQTEFQRLYTYDEAKIQAEGQSPDECESEDLITLHPSAAADDCDFCTLMICVLAHQDPENLHSWTPTPPLTHCLAISTAYPYYL